MGPTFRLVSCAEDCFLNIFLQSTLSQFSLPRSNPQSPGLIIASGSIGKYQTQDNAYFGDYIGVFVSNDAGQNWKMIAQGQYIFEVLNHGSIIVLVPKGIPTNILIYSMDQGTTLRQFKFTQEPIEILAMTVKSHSHLRKVLISASSPQGYQKKAQIFTVDFSDIYQRDCVHYQEDLEKSDYEEWSPVGSNGCLDGREIVFQRKKVDRDCYNSDDQEFYYVRRVCQCTKDDFHCDFGYVKNDQDQCVLEEDIDTKSFF